MAILRIDILEVRTRAAHSTWKTRSTHFSVLSVWLNSCAVGRFHLLDLGLHIRGLGKFSPWT